MWLVFQNFSLYERYPENKMCTLYNICTALLTVQTQLPNRVETVDESVLLHGSQ